MNETSNHEKKKGLSKLFTMEMPHTYLLIFAILVICAILTYVIPAGQFDTAPNETGREILIPGTFHAVEQNPVSLYDFFNAIPTGLSEMSSLIFFVMIAGKTLRDVFPDLLRDDRRRFLCHHQRDPDD